MARAMWKGAISFSLVHIPVSLYPAAREDTLDLDLLDRRDFAPVGFRRYNKTTGHAVEWKDIVKGFQYRKGEYVVLTEEDFRRANVKATQTIEIQQFVEASEVPPYFFETPYFVVPDAKAGKVYRLLHDVLEKTGHLGIATVVLRTRQNVVALLPVGDMIVMNTLRFATELLPAIPSEAVDGAAKPSARELQMAERLVADMTDEWRPERFHDTYVEDLRRRIAEKVKAGQARQLTAPPRTRASREPKGKVVDLMALLEESLGARGGKAPTRHRTRSRKTTSRTRRRRAA